jgi:drug/metabolite transporter (DMT)-like permease
LALIEVLYAQLIARFSFGQRITPREAVGMLLVVGGVVLLILTH